MIETHPFEIFVPSEIKYLLLGSFATKPSAKYDWYYSNGRNHFWPILEKVYSVKLGTVPEKKELLGRLRIGVTDIILSCERKNNNNLDNNLTNITYNTNAINNVVNNNNIIKIFFSSRYVQGLFNKQFSDLASEHNNIDLVYLPSPSPRYAAMSRDEKIKRYKELLPRLS